MWRLRTATAVVSVGCCYQWVTEAGDEALDTAGAGGDVSTVPPSLPSAASVPVRIITNPNHQRDHLATLSSVPGYPLSETGAQWGVRLGRRARNVANQVLKRLREGAARALAWH